MIAKTEHEDPRRKCRSDRRRLVSHLLELVDIGDSLGEGGLELIELLLDDITVTAGSLTLSLGSNGVDLASSDITSKGVNVASAGDTRVAT